MELSFTTLFSENLFVFFIYDPQMTKYGHIIGFTIDSVSNGVVWCTNAITVNCEWAKTCYFYTNKHMDKMRPRNHHRKPNVTPKQLYSIGKFLVMVSLCLFPLCMSAKNVILMSNQIHEKDQTNFRMRFWWNIIFCSMNMMRILTTTSPAPATTNVRRMLPKVHNCRSRQYYIFCANQSMKFKFDNI